MAPAEPLMVWMVSVQAFRQSSLVEALQIDRRLGREQLQDFALERGIAEREARQIGAIDRIHCQLVGRAVELARCVGVRRFACQARFSPLLDVIRAFTRGTWRPASSRSLMNRIMLSSA